MASKKKRGSAYAQSGVDIELGNRVKTTLPQLLASTRRPGALGKVGGFGGLFELDVRRYKNPVLVSSVDGVGTKLKVAFAMDRHDTIGQDLVNHCVNDIAVLGCEPLFFLDYLGTGKLKPHVFEQIVSGFAKACSENRCALIGGETAQMPGFYQKGEYDVSGTIVGVVEKKEMLDGKSVRPGDALIGVASNGLHTNGYSLARRVFFEIMGLRPKSRLADLGGCSVGEELLKVHVSYFNVLQKILKRFNAAGLSPRARPVKAMAHITGGGFIDNLPRCLPGHCDAVVRKGSWDSQAVFDIIQKAGKVDETEMHQVFNMGIGLVLIVDDAHAAAILQSIRRARHKAWIIGSVEPGNGRCRLSV